MALRKDLTGKRFGRLIVLRYTGRNPHRESIYLCKCRCGKRREILGYLLKSGNAQRRGGVMFILMVPFTHE